MAVVEQRRVLHEIDPDDLVLDGQAAQHGEHLDGGEAAGLRVRRAGNMRRIQHVDVDGNVDPLSFRLLFDFVPGRVKPVALELGHVVIVGADLAHVLQKFRAVIWASDSDVVKVVAGEPTRFVGKAARACAVGEHAPGFARSSMSK